MFVEIFKKVPRISEFNTNKGYKDNTHKLIKFNML